MDREKQINEMVMVLTESQHAFDRAWKECLHNNTPMPDRENVFYAKYLVEKEGYRKTSDIAMEIFDEIENKKRFIQDHTGNIGIVVTLQDIAELKKKYTEGKK